MKLFQSKLNAIIFAAASTLILSGSANALTPNLGDVELENLGDIQVGPVFPGVLWQPFDTKTFSGAMCQSYFGSQGGDFNQTHYSMYNKTSSFRSVSCPLVLEDSFAHIEQSLQTEYIDHNWSDKATTVIEQAFESEMLSSSSIQSIDCRTTICRLQVEHSAPKAIESFQLAFPGLVADILPDISSEPTPEHNSLERVYLLTRSNF